MPTDPVVATRSPSAASPDDPADAVFAWLRAMLDAQPVHLDDQGVWHLFRHTDVVRALSDAATFSSDTRAFTPSQPDLDAFARGNIVDMDPPRHRKLRALVNSVFTPRVVAGLAPRISEITTSLLDAVRDETRFDLVDALAYPLPITVIAELLGVPVEDQPRFRSWAEALFSQQAVDSSALPNEELVSAIAPTIREMNAYLMDQVRERRRHPTNDLIGRLTEATVDGERLDDEEIVGFAGVLLLAGHVTTTALLGNAVYLLDRHPQAVAELRADPGLVPSAVEEVLRLRTPFPRVARVTTSEVEIGGKAVPAGRLVVPWLAAANRDPSRFPSPESFDIHRDSGGHLAFGHGVHFCLGAPLARLEATVALRVLLNRYRDIALDSSDGLAFHNPWLTIALKRLPVLVTA